MPSSRSKTLSVVIPLELLEQLEKVAESRRWSVSQTARIFIEESIERLNTETKDAKPK
jgi:predicted DNA-binding protein